MTKIILQLSAQGTVIGISTKANIDDGSKQKHQQFILHKSNKNGHIKMYEDERLDVFDLCLMKRMLINNSK